MTQGQLRQNDTIINIIYMQHPFLFLVNIKCPAFEIKKNINKRAFKLTYIIRKCAWLS